MYQSAMIEADRSLCYAMLVGDKKKQHWTRLDGGLGGRHEAAADKWKNSDGQETMLQQTRVGVLVVVVGGGWQRMVAVDDSMLGVGRPLSLKTTIALSTAAENARQ